MMGFLVFTAVLVSARAALPIWLRWYVNRTIDQSPIYQGTIGKVDVQLWQGGYTIHDIQINKTTGNTPVPFFAAKQVHLVMEWKALLSRRLVGRIVMDEPELNFVDAADESSSQTGADAPWLQIIRDLFPFKINSAVVENGAIHFRAFDRDPPVDVYLSKLDGRIDNLTNIYRESTPLVTSVEARGLAMDQAKFQYKMKLDPFSYRPTFHMGVRLIGLDVRKINDLATAYGHFDFKSGYFDLVIELDSNEGVVQGYVKPLFRGLHIFDLRDVVQTDPLTTFWEGLLEVTTQALKNQQRDQFGTLIPLAGSVSGGGTQADILATVGNVLKNAFIRAYLPRFEPAGAGLQESSDLEFGPAEPVSVAPSADNR
jgi:hypothetical protein